MRKITYLCIDDEPRETSAPLLDRLKTLQPRLDFSFTGPTEFSKLLRQIRDFKPDGIILDIRLDENANEAGERVDFRGLAVAQELRTRMTEGVISSFPIVLWSVIRKFTESYSSDLTSHDLFDTVYDKEGHVTDDPERVARELVALYDGYTRIGAPRKKRQPIEALLDLTVTDASLIDPRFWEFQLDPHAIPAHDLVGHILHRLVIPTGPLIAELYLAARLGIDIEQSQDWPKLLRKLKEEVGYTGIFSTGWPRWWSHKLIAWWEGLKGKPGRLQKTDASKRVEFLRKVTRLRSLVAASPIDKTSTSTYWTVCRVLNRPLDPADGIRLRSTNNLPFHEPLYASISAVLSRKHVQSGYEIDPLELPRLERLKKNAKKAEVK